MTATIPNPGVQPGEYSSEWFLDDRTIAGELDVTAGRPPKVVLFGDVVPRDWSQGGGFPESHQFDRVRGRTRSGMDVVLTDAHIDIWFPHRSIGSARHAVVEIGAADVPNDAYPRIRFQLTDLDLLFGRAPIKSVSWPGEGTPSLHGQYAIEVNPDAHHEWEDDAGFTLSCTYDLRFSLTDAHAHHVVFAPVVAICSDATLTVDEWIDQWVMPLLRLAALGTRRPQRLAWLTVNTRPRGEPADERRRDTNGTVFGSGIQQAPYEAEYREEWREPRTGRSSLWRPCRCPSRPLSADGGHWSRRRTRSWSCTASPFATQTFRRGLVTSTSCRRLRRSTRLSIRSMTKRPRKRSRRGAPRYSKPWRRSSCRLGRFGSSRTRGASGGLTPSTVASLI